MNPRMPNTMAWITITATKLAWKVGIQRSGVHRASAGPTMPAITPPEVT
jgi:hypothetical protein